MNRLQSWLLVVIILPSMLSLVQAATIRVPQDEATIQNAVNAAAAGDRIVVSKGVYRERVVISGKRDLLIVGKGKPRIDGEATGTTVTIADSTEIALKGFVIVRGFPHGVLISHSTVITIQKCTVQDAADRGVRAADSKWILIQKNVIEDTGDHAVELRDTDHSSVRKNRINRAGADGATVIYGTGNQIVGNRIADCGEHGIAIDGPANEVVKNRITTVGMTGIMVRDVRNEVVKNRVADTTDYGLGILSSENTASKNKVEDARGFGIFVEDGSQNLVEKCKVSNSIGDGFCVVSTGNHFARNRISGSGGLDVRSFPPETANTWVDNNYQTFLFDIP